MLPERDRVAMYLASSLGVATSFRLERRGIPRLDRARMRCP
jgi:hypothetical protein